MAQVSALLILYYALPLGHLLCPNQMSSAKKSIGKTGTTVPALVALCSKSIVAESIAAGKADEIVAALRASDEGMRALRKIAPEPVKCIIVNRSSGKYGDSEGFCAYLRLNERTEFLFLLLESYTPPTLADGAEDINFRHHLGGYGINFNNSKEVGGWVSKCIESMDLNDARIFFEKTLEICIPQEDEDGEEVDSANHWLCNDDDVWALP